MTLGEKQELFSFLVAQLIIFAYSRGYGVRMAWAYRSPEANALIGGHPNSNHTRKLAIDLDLFRDGEYLTESSDHEPLGVFWESLHPECRWGGRFSNPDGNHYSLEFEGMK